VRYLSILLRLRAVPFLGRLVVELLSLYTVEVPPRVRIGRDFVLAHRGQGVVLSEQTVIGDRVTIFHQVTIGAADVTDLPEAVGFAGVVLEDDVIVCAGAKIMGGNEELRVRRGTIVGANAVLTRSTGEFEIWGGVPARKIGSRARIGSAS
jgi:serine O-acetyltransferase